MQKQLVPSVQYKACSPMGDLGELARHSQLRHVAIGGGHELGNMV